MQPNDLSLATDPALRGSMEALKRAAALARQTAIQTGTALIVMEGGRLIRIPPGRPSIPGPVDRRPLMTQSE